MASSTTLHFDLPEHLSKEHRINTLSTYLREIVYGANDGIVTTFAVVAGFAGSQANPATSSVPLISVLLFGFANLFADGLSMSLGSFLSIRADQDVYKTHKRKEAHEIVHEPKMEQVETIEILKNKGFSTRDAETLTTIFMKNPTYWVEFMMRDELNMANPEDDNPLVIGLVTFLSFVLFGLIPLVPYLILPQGISIFPYSIGATVIALLILGLLRAFVTRHSTARAIAETLLVGGIAAVAAYYVGTIFRAP